MGVEVASPSEVTGVGAVFEVNRDGELYVHHLVAGGSAERSCQVSPGDVLVAVGDVSVVKQPWTYVRQLVMGPAGTYVRLHLRRGDSIHEVRLMRGTPVYFEMLEDQRRLEVELDTYNDKLNHSTAEINSLQAELERLRNRPPAVSQAALVKEHQLKVDIEDCVDQTQRVHQMLKRAEQHIREEQRLRAEAEARIRPLNAELMNLRQLDADMQQTLEHLRQRHHSETGPLEKRVQLQETQLVEHHTQNNELQRQLEEVNHQLSVTIQQLQRQKERENDMLRRFRECVRFSDELGRGFDEQTRNISMALNSFDRVHSQFFESMQPPPDVQRHPALQPVLQPTTTFFNNSISEPQTQTSLLGLTRISPSHANVREANDAQPVFIA